MNEKSAVSTTTPYLTLGLMCGDTHAKNGLSRALKSVIERTSGEPLVDEIVLGWNGKDNDAVEAALSLVGYMCLNDARLEFEPYATQRPVLPPIRVVQYSWPGRFDLARNEYWRQCRGEWVMWLDCDDVVADAGTTKGLKAIERVEKDYGIPPPQESSNAPSTSRARYSPTLLLSCFSSMSFPFC